MPSPTNSPGKAGRKPHACYCGRAFIRKEHLVRHQASHRGASHVCSICRRSFTRSDLLRRHSRGHTETRGPGRRIRQACDACHARKTRCNGALPCRACVERSVACTFPGDAPGPREDAGDAPSSQPSTHTDSAHDGEGGLCPDTFFGDKYTFLRSLKVSSPAQDDSQRSNLRLAERLLKAPNEMQTLLGVLKDGTMASLHPVIEASGQFGAWAERCSQSYFGRPHETWTLLHAPSFRIGTDDLFVAASVILMGLLVDQDVPQQVRDAAEECHRLMVEQHLQKLVALELDGHATPWPVEWYQAVLLSITAGFCIRGTRMVAKLRLLCGLFVAHLRCVGMFDSEAAAQQVARHFSGTFPPYKVWVVDRRARLVSYLFKADALLSLACGQVPHMQLEELDIPVAQAFGPWNAFGLAVAAKRMTTTHSRRISQQLIGHLSQQGPASTELLVEDVELGLCGLARDVWLCGVQRRAGRGDGEARHAVLGRLEGWRRQLERLQAASRAALGGASHESHGLLSAYRGDDDAQPESEWRASAAQRLARRLQEASDLHGALHADLHGQLSGQYRNRIRHMTGVVFPAGMRDRVGVVMD